MNRRRTAGRLIAALIALSMVAAACGDDDDDDDGSDAAAESTTTAPPAGTGDTTTTAAVVGGDETTTDETTTTAGAPVEVRGLEDGVLTVGGISQPAQWVGIDDGMNARIARFNAEGGIQGITEIENLGIRDDGADADRSLALIRELVQQDNVFAVLPITPTATPPSAGDFLAEERVPFLGSGYAPVLCNNDYGFAYNGCAVPGINEAPNEVAIEIFAEIAGTDSLDGVKFAVTASADSTGPLFGDYYGEFLSGAGAEVVYNEANVPAGATDMQPFVDAITASDPDIVIMVLGFAETLGLKAAMVANGFDGSLVDFATYVPGLLEQAPAIGTTLKSTYSLATSPILEEDTPYVAQMKADFEAAGLEFTGFGSAQGYLAADLFIQMLEAVAPNYDRFAEIINEGFTSAPADGGIVATFPEFHTAAPSCGGLVRVEGGAYSVISGFRCSE